MDLIEIDWKNEKQRLFVMELLKELHIKPRVISEGREYQLYGEGFKQSILAGKAAFDNGDISQFISVKKEDIF